MQVVCILKSNWLIVCLAEWWQIHTSVQIVKMEKLHLEDNAVLLAKLAKGYNAQDEKL